MNRWNLFIKWLGYGLTLIPVWILERLILSRFPLFGVIPVLLPFAAVVVGMMEGMQAGAGFGLATGLLCDMLYYGTNGGMTVGVTLLGAAAGLAAYRGLRQNLPGCMLCCAAALLIIDAFRVLFRVLFHSVPLGPLIRVALLETVWSLVFAPAVYFLFRATYRKVGGTTLM
ncbi:hypothetical protein SDC9_66247 [bioreactor metagenome]|uniref:Rod shape-determining protein MreD n=1 Tax=bioreactor metagenome TaxID=1076179 RepID=A0A644XVQ8_9ZZZZ